MPLFGRGDDRRERSAADREAARLERERRRAEREGRPLPPEPAAASGSDDDAPGDEVSLSDPTGTLATPIDHIERPGTRKGLARVADLVREREVGRVVVGLPLGLSGADTDQTRETREWAAKLAERVRPVPVELYDERFTTAIAAREFGPHPPRTSEDSRAAAVLLDDWLVRHAREVTG